MPLKVLELLISNNEQAEICLHQEQIVDVLSQILVFYGWRDSSVPREGADSIIRDTTRILATLMIRSEA